MRKTLSTIDNILHNTIKHIAIYTAKKISSVKFKDTDRYWSTKIKVIRLKHAELIGYLVSRSLYVSLALVSLLIIRRIFA